MLARVIAVDPMALARRQLATDRARTKRFPLLFARKLARMSASPLAFLRGAAPLFYELLDTHPSLAEGPRGKGWLVGDLHIENFGAYRPNPTDNGTRSARDATFNLNDFDDAIIGPWRFDVLRFTTSLLLAGRELGADGTRALDLCHGMLDAYVDAAFHHAKPPRQPEAVQRLVAQVTARTRKQLLDARTVVTHGARRFVRGDRYIDLPPGLARKVPRAFARYVETLGDNCPSDDAMQIVDYAQRIAGTGSLGGVRVAVLVRGKGSADGGWIFDMKEQGMPAAARILGDPEIVPAERVAQAFRACVAHPAHLIGTTEMGGLSMFVRKLTPQEDKLNLGRLRDADLDPLATYLGALLGAAHLRGATKTPKHPWTRSERAETIHRAIAIAGIHEAVYLALCKVARDQRAGDDA